MNALVLRVTSLNNPVSFHAEKNKQSLTPIEKELQVALKHKRNTHNTQRFPKRDSLVFDGHVEIQYVLRSSAVQQMPQTHSAYNYRKNGGNTIWLLFQNPLKAL